MRPVLLPTLICTACLVFLTACGSSKSVFTGDFTEYAEQFEGATVELNYYSFALEERIVLGSNVVENGSFELSCSFNEDVPRNAWLSIKRADPQSEFFVNVLLEKNASYDVRIIDEPHMWFRIDSDGKYAHIREVPLQDQIKLFNLQLEFSALVEQSRANGQDRSLSHIDGEHPEDTVREPSVHANVLDWENMSCEDYTGEFETFWERRLVHTNHIENTEVREFRQRLDDLHERLYTQRYMNILNTSSDPVERLLTLETHFSLELNTRIRVLEELESELPIDVVEERISPRLESLREEQQRRRNNAALKLGSIIPHIDLTLIDQQTITLSSVLEQNQLVVLDVWDNYCETCIEAFQKYRSFYSEYAELGLEVVNLSLEGVFDDWIEKSEELDFPWVNAFAPDGRDGDIAKLFGIRSPRGNYVIDSEGCILKRDLTPDELLDFLGARLGS